MARTKTTKTRGGRVTRPNIRRPEDTGETFEVVAERVTKAGKSATPTGTTVNLKRASLHVAGQVFQWRMPKRNMIESDDHILDMAKQVHETNEPLDPILVFPVGNVFYVMDGHHRLAAYDTAGWTGDIPARVYPRTLDEAWRAALGGNTKKKLAMTKEEKLNAAWTIVKRGDPRDSVASTAKLCLIATSTVDNMRSTLKKLKKGNLATPEEMKSLSWERARMKVLGRTEWSEREDWIEQEAQKLADALYRAKLVGRLTKNPDITAAALALVNQDLPAALMAEWMAEEQELEFDPHAPLSDDEKNF